MAKKKRRDVAFSLSFLDIMACGFGAVTLLFLIIRHGSVVIELSLIHISEPTRPLYISYAVFCLKKKIY